MSTDKGPALLHIAALGLSAEQIKTFSAYREMLTEWNRRINLTSIKEPEEVEIKHFYDSLLLARCAKWPGGEAPRAVDIGGGAGFPGIALKIAYRQIALDTLEASEKKVKFLLALAEALGLEGTRAYHLRAEEAGREAAFREKYDWALSRGLASVPVLLEYSLPLLKVGGYMAAYKGPAGEREAAEGKKAEKALGGVLVEVVKEALPDGQGERSILIYRKDSPTPGMYPRRPGEPAKKPIR